MSRFAFLLSLAGACLMTVGCSSRSLSLTGDDPFQTDGDPFQAAAAMSSQEASTQTASKPPTTPGYALMNDPSRVASAGGSRPGWSTTRYAPPMSANAAMPPPRQIADRSQDHLQLTFRASTSEPESTTEVVKAAAMPSQATAIPAIGSSESNERLMDDPFQEGSVKNADFTGNETSSITQLGAEQTSQASPATLEMPVFADDEDPFRQPAPTRTPTSNDEWWNQ